MSRKATPSLLIIATLLALVAAITLGRQGQQVAAGEAQSGGPVFLPTMKNSLELTSLTLTIEVGGIGADTAVAITHAGDSRLFIATQAGRIYVVQRDPVTYEVTGMSLFLDLVGKVNVSFEEGLLGLVFHPDYVNNGWFYVIYSEFGSGNLTLARYSRSADPNVADPNSRSILLSIPKPPNTPDTWPPHSPVHNGGDLHFGADGYLYIAIGDGGPDPNELGPPWPADPDNHGQRLDTLFGKMLRIDVNQLAPLPPSSCNSGPGSGYTIPADNPFADGSGGFCDEIWSYGWRNPWRFSFDPLTGNMYVADVGEWQTEELNFEPAGVSGRNYGWHCFEGSYDHRNVPHVQGDCSQDNSIYTFPFFEWGRDKGCSAIGGYVYRGSNSPAMRGYYFFADFCADTIWAADTENLDAAPRTPVITVENGSGTPQWTTLGTDVRGEIYMGGFFHNAIYHLSAP